jgi:transposase-like protein
VRLTAADPDFETKMPLAEGIDLAMPESALAAASAFGVVRDHPFVAQCWTSPPAPARKTISPTGSATTSPAPFPNRKLSAPPLWMEQNPIPDPPRPPATPRRGRWTPALQARFLGLLMQGGNVSAAARALGLSASSAHRLRQRLAGTQFDRDWDEALRLHDHYRAHPLALDALAAAIAGRGG